MSWRKLVRSLHRDVGYATAALVIAYSISGLAVNHIDDWNPNYTFTETAVDIGPIANDDLDVMQRRVVEALSLDPGSVRGRFLETETRFRVFLPDGQEVQVETTTGVGTIKRIDTRFLLYEVNALHLNSIKGIWTWVADLFAIALLGLAITGVLIHKGRQGLAGRGKWFVGAGFLVPVAFILYIYFGGGGGGH